MHIYFQGTMVLKSLLPLLALSVLMSQLFVWWQVRLNIASRN